MTRKIILNLAISLDGYICDDEGGYEWIVGHGDSTLDTLRQFDFNEFMDSCDVVLMGRNAYEDNGVEHILEYGAKKIIVATKQSRPNEGLIEFTPDPVKKIRALMNERGKNIWLFGGALLTQDFIKADLIDEYIIGVIPIILGNGRKLYQAKYPRIKLHLEEITVKDGIVISRYTKARDH